jgi:flagellar hook-length control protein FliK
MQVPTAAIPQVPSAAGGAAVTQTGVAAGATKGLPADFTTLLLALLGQGVAAAGSAETAIGGEIPADGDPKAGGGKKETKSGGEDQAALASLASTATAVPGIPAVATPVAACSAGGAAGKPGASDAVPDVLGSVKPALADTQNAPTAASKSTAPVVTATSLEKGAPELAAPPAAAPAPHPSDAAPATPHPTEATPVVPQVAAAARPAAEQAGRDLVASAAGENDDDAGATEPHAKGGIQAVTASKETPSTAPTATHGGQTKGEHEEGGEPGRRESDGGVEVAGVRGLGHGEIFEAKKTDGGADPSAPSPLPSTTPRETPRLEATSLPKPAASTPDVERFMRLEELRTPQVRDGGEMRLHLSPEGLGPVEVRIAVRADAVHTTLFAAQDDARQALAASRDALAAALGRSHLRLEGFTIGADQHGGHEGLRDQQAEHEARAALHAAFAGGTETTMPFEPASDGSGLSLRA